MARNETIGGFWTSLLSPVIYKRSQGKRVRQMTGGLIIGWVLFGCWTMYNGPLLDLSREVRLGVPVVIGVVASWLAFRLVNVPQFADFLIAVEVEMKKISWPTLAQCVRAAAVVIVTMILLAAVLFAYDQFWMWLFRLLKILQI